MLCSDILDKFLDQNGFTNAGTTEQTNLTTLCIRSKKVDDLDTCLQNLYGWFLIFETWRISVDHPMLCIIQSFSTVNCLSKNIKKSSKSAVSHRNLDSTSCGNYFSVSLKSLTGAQHNAANHIISQMLRNFHNAFLTIVFDFKGVLDIRKIAILKNNIYNRSHDLYNLTFTHYRPFLFWAFAPLQTSVISCVIAA